MNGVNFTNLRSLQEKDETENAIELYIHIPFCKSKCAYCDFASYAGRDDLMEAYAGRVRDEMAAWRGVDVRAVSVYIGGGTPSRMPGALLASLLDTARETFSFSPDCEITCEANPGTLTSDWLDRVRAAGVNRLSLGAQTKSPALLKTIGRIHTWDQVVQGITMARGAGFERLSLDLMIGLPGQTLADALDTLEAALSLDPGHISLYGLILEEGTPLHAACERGETRLPDAEDERAMYWACVRRLARVGYAQYEISNFARLGMACRHNIGYWTRVPYLGFGVAAHSFFRGERFSNPASLDAYLRGEHGTREPVTEADARFESLMLGLRMNAGVPERAFEAMHGISLRAYLCGRETPLIARGLLTYEHGALRLTERGMDIQNSVLVDLME